jgi:acylphosphatase
MSGAAGRVRWTIRFSGEVQGVGFRYQTEHAARRFEVAGYVRNLADGSVEAVAEGEPDELRRFTAAVEEVMGGRIRERQYSQSPGTGEFQGFHIRY